MKIAIISDIHGNLDALQSVLNDVKRQEISKIFICGDLAVAGPEPVKTVDFIIDLAKKRDIKIIQGNTDEMIVKSTGKPGDKYTPPNKIMAEAVKYAQTILRDDQKEFIAKLPEIYSEKIGNLNVLLVHGSPRRNNEDIMPDMPTERVREMIESTSEDIIFCGHTHLPAIYNIDNKTVVNVGSVGRPFLEKPHACCAVLDYSDFSSKNFSIDQRYIDYDYESAAKKLEKLEFEGSNKLAQMLRKATSRYPE